MPPVAHDVDFVPKQKHVQQAVLNLFLLTELDEFGDATLRATTPPKIRNAMVVGHHNQIATTGSTFHYCTYPHPLLSPCFAPQRHVHNLHYMPE